MRPAGGGRGGLGLASSHGPRCVQGHCVLGHQVVWRPRAGGRLALRGHGPRVEWSVFSGEKAWVCPSICDSLRNYYHRTYSLEKGLQLNHRHPVKAGSKRSELVQGFRSAKGGKNVASPARGTK